MKNTTPELRDRQIRAHLKMIEDEFPLLKELVTDIATFDTSKVKHLAKEISQLIENPKKIIDGLRNKVAELKKELEAKATSMDYQRAPRFNHYEEGETLGNLKFKEIAKIIFRLIFGRIKKIKIIPYE